MKTIDKTKQGIAEGAKSMAGAAAAAMTASVGNTARLVKNTFENTSKSVTAPKITGNAMQGKNSFGTSSKSTAAPKSMNNTASHENPFEKPIKIIGNAMKRADNAVRRENLALGKGPIDPNKAGTASLPWNYKNIKANEDKFKDTLFEDSLLIDTSNPDTPFRRPSVEEQKARIERAAKKNAIVYDSKYTPEQQRIFRQYKIKKPDEFTNSDLAAWAEKYGDGRYDVVTTSGADFVARKTAEKKFSTYAKDFINYNVDVFTGDSTNRIKGQVLDNDFKMLKALAGNNDRRKDRERDLIGGENDNDIIIIDSEEYEEIPSFRNRDFRGNTEGQGDLTRKYATKGLSLGITDWFNELNTKTAYKEAGFRDEDYVSISDEWKKTEEAHPYLTGGSEMAGGIIGFGKLGEFVKGGLEATKWFSKMPKLLRHGVQMGTTMAAADATKTATSGGSVKDVALSAGRGFVGGMAGGIVAEKVGDIGKKILTNKGWRHKVIPEIVRNMSSAGAFSIGNSGATYFMYPEGSRPTPEQMAQDMFVSFAFAAIMSGKEQMSISKENKAVLDNLCDKMSADYNAMKNLNVSGKNDRAGIEKFAKNVIAYTDAAESMLTGKEVNTTIDGVTFKHEPGEFRVVGQDKYVKQILSELGDIRSGAQAYLNNTVAEEGTKILNGAEVPTKASVTQNLPVSQSAVTGGNAQTLDADMGVIGNKISELSTTAAKSNFAARAAGTVMDANLRNNEDKIPGLLIDKYTDALPNEEKTALDIIGKKLGVSIKAVESITVHPETGERTSDTTTANGAYYNGVIYLSLEASDKPMVVMSHEITHYMATRAIAEFKLYSNHVLNALANVRNTDVQSIVNEKIVSYERRGISLDHNKAVEEIAADYTRKFLNDTDSAVEFINSIENIQARRSILRRFVDAIGNILSKLRSSFKKIPQAVRDLYKAQVLFNDMAKATAEEHRNTFTESVRQNGNVVFADRDISYSIDKTFTEQVRDVLHDNTTTNNHIYVGETTSILKQLGLNDKPMLITSGHIKDINHKKVNGVSRYHGLSEETINKLPYILDHPAIVFDSFSVNNSDAVCMLSEITDGDGLPIMVIIKPDGRGKYNDVRIDSNFILSMYGKDNPQGFLNQIGNNIDNVLFADKKRTRELLGVNRLQLPKSFNNLRFNTIIHQSRNVVKSEIKPNFSLSIKRDTTSKINNITYSQQFKRWFGDWEKHPNSSSAVVNEDGTPKVVYHGTPRGGFTRFDTFGGLSKYSMFDNSPYFTESRGIADSYMKTGIGSNPERYEAYLNIRNPIDMDAPADVKKWNKTLTQYKYDTRAENGNTNGDVYRALEEEIEGKRDQLWKDADSAQYVVERMGYDGITHMSIEQDSGESHRVWIAFNPNQVKSAASNVGTFGLVEPDIRYSLKRDSLIPAEREEKHTPEQLKVMKEYEASVDNDILKFAKYARANPNDNRTSITISEVTPKAAKDIQRLTGIDVEGFGHSIKTNTIRHIDEGHGVNGSTDHSMADDNDIARIRYVLDNYDNIDLLSGTSREYRDKSQRPAPMVRYSKRVDGTYYIVEAVPDTKKHQLAIVTVYKPAASTYKKKR